MNLQKERERERERGRAKKKNHSIIEFKANTQLHADKRRIEAHFVEK
mgnify:CR=1 FL=1